MNHKQVEERLTKATVREWITCDLCGLEIKERDIFDTYTGGIYMKEETSYGDSGSATETRADICKDCFTDRVIPALEGICVRFRTEETDW